MAKQIYLNKLLILITVMIRLKDPNQNYLYAAQVAVTISIVHSF